MGFRVAGNEREGEKLNGVYLGCIYILALVFCSKKFIPLLGLFSSGMRSTQPFIWAPRAETHCSKTRPSITAFYSGHVIFLTISDYPQRGGNMKWHTAQRRHTLRWQKLLVSDPICVTKVPEVKSAVISLLMPFMIVRMSNLFHICFEEALEISKCFKQK